MKSLLLNLFATKMPFSSNYYQLFSFPQISFFSVFEKHLMLRLVVLFSKSWSFLQFFVHPSCYQMFSFLKKVLEWLCFYFVLNETSSSCNYNYPIHFYDKDSNLRVIFFCVQQPLLQRTTLCCHF